MMARVTRLFILSIALFGILLAGTAQPALAQGQPPITASVDRNALTTDDTLTLTVVVNASSQQPPQPQLPSLEGFAVVGSSTSSQLQIVNGVVSSSVAYAYRLQPLQTGALTIDPVEVTLDGQTYSTQPITVQVSQGTGSPTQATGGAAGGTIEVPAQLGNNDLFVQAVVDNPEPYVGEQIVYTFRFFEAANSALMPSILSGQPDYGPPALTGFWAEGDPEQRSYRASINGRLYTVTELSSILFPTAAGELTIEPARLTIPGSVFQRGGTMQTDPVTVNVKPLPAGEPASFNGAVGRFDIQAQVDAAETRVDEPITMKITLVGQGNISTLADPVWPQMDGWRIFEGDTAVNTTVQDGQVVGTRTYERVMIPTQAGESTIPAIEYSYFDPADEAYHEISTQPIPVTVTPGAAGAAGPAKPANAESGDDNATPPAAEETGELGLKPAPAVMRMAAAPVATEPWYWLLWAVPMAALAGGFAWRRRQRYLLRTADVRRSSRAHKEARKVLNKVRRSQDPLPERFAAVEWAIYDYLDAKLGRSVTGLSSHGLATELGVRGIPGPVIADLQACLDGAETGRYSPAGGATQELDALLDRTERMLDELDGEWA
jgi:hypothetical protein